MRDNLHITGDVRARKERTVRLLRSYELAAYRIAYYMLQDEKKAFAAAAQALLAVAGLPGLLALTEEERQAAVKRAALRESLQVARDRPPSSAPFDELKA